MTYFQKDVSFLHKVLLTGIPELKGKALGTYCYPEECHDEVLKEWVEKG